MKAKKSIMNFNLNLTLYFAVLLLLSAIFFTGADMSCDSCGRECARACGTKHFRTCCFNYLRKRSAPLEAEQNPNSIIQSPFDALTSFERKLESWIRDTRELEDTLRENIAQQRVNNLKKRRTASSDEFLELS
ncbi:unnamed protein product [Hermetia illucens]|uniref:Trissin n=1 Tax=Hermetia illucens TaxID=343691 RepID=A0A7R8V6I6_HERIL|nr:uncharacterized protein LOC119659297 [Hermetia illucens]CAD7093000.1 unnamed protein product [Hermetia illucens]